ncbi:unnamed protein product [Trichogramma brassicae]|uniref:Uncharacterized protein n=1 Tax=Trichogramma brassicae TaxID=86971 RepID=A0A6H5J900_9HYME|nr:unnamed protein product [Trichogramma brassicae]
MRAAAWTTLYWNTAEDITLRRRLKTCAQQPRSWPDLSIAAMRIFASCIITGATVPRSRAQLATISVARRSQRGCISIYARHPENVQVLRSTIARKMISSRIESRIVYAYVQRSCLQFTIKVQSKAQLVAGKGISACSLAARSYGIVFEIAIAHSEAHTSHARAQGDILTVVRDCRDLELVELQCAVCTCGQCARISYSKI